MVDFKGEMNVMKDEKNYDVLLIYPPLVKLGIHTYYLSLPLLAAQLKRSSFSVKQIDLNRDTIYDFLEGDNLFKIKNFCLENINAISSEKQQSLYKELLIEVEYAISNLDKIQKSKYKGDFNIDGINISKLFHRTLDYLETGDVFKEGTYSNNDCYFDNIYNDDYIEKYITKFIKKEEVCIAFSITMGPQLGPALSIAKSIKKKFPSIRIIFGGPVISLMPNDVHSDILSRGFVDILMRYEGEIELPKLIKKIMNKESYDDVFNITYMKCEEILCNPNKFNTCDLNLTEFPEYDEGLINKYKIDMFSILQSRGCYWRRCSFCDYTNLYGNYTYCTRKPEILCKEIKILKDKYGVTTYQIINESMTAAYAKEFSKQILENDLDIEWSTFIKVEKNCFDAETLNLMKKSGCKKVTIGVESLDNNVLANLNKGYKREDIITMFDVIASVDIKVVVNLIIDAPITTWESALEQYMICKEYSKKMNVTYNYFSFELTRTSQMGKNPSLYGIELVNDECLEKSMKGLVKNTMNYTHKHKWTEDKLNYLKSAYYKLNLITKCKNDYPENYYIINKIIKNRIHDENYKLIINETNKIFMYKYEDLTNDLKENFLFILDSSIILNGADVIESVYKIIQDNSEITIKDILKKIHYINEADVFFAIKNLMLYEIISSKPS